MGKIKRVPFEKKKEVLFKGKRFYRTVQDAADAKKLLNAYAPQANDYDLVEFAAANNISKTELCKHFAISTDTFNKHFEDHYTRGKFRKNMKVTQTLFSQAVGREGIWDAKKRRWLVPPAPPDNTALIWWDKTRGGWREGTDVNVKGKGLQSGNRVTQVMVFLPPNGREVGANGDPTYIQRKIKEFEAKKREAEDV